MMKLVFKMSAWVLAFALISCTASAEDLGRREYTKTVKKEFDIASNGTTYLSNKYGRIDVKTWDKNRVKISVDIIVNANSEKDADAVFERIGIDFSDASDYVKASTNIESKKSSWWKGWNNGNKSDYNINYEVYLPASNNLDIAHKYGDVYVAAMRGKVNFNLKYANFKVESVGDDSRIDFAYGNGAVLEAKDLSSTLSYAKLNIEESSDLELISKYSQIWVEKAGDVRCQTKYDTYRLGEINDFKNEGKYDNFSIDEADNITLAGKYSSLKSATVSGSVDLDMEYGSATYELGSDFKEASMNGKYTSFKVAVASGARYKLDAVSTYAGITYPSDLEVTREIKKSSSQEVKAYKGSENAPAIIRATLNYGGLRVREL